MCNIILTKCHELIDELSHARVVEELHAACAKFCHEIGYNHFFYGARIPTSFIKPSYIFVSGYPTDWWGRYQEAGYMAIDPAVSYCASHNTPITWQQLVVGDDNRVRQFMGEAGEFGLRSGISFPVHSAHGESAMLSVVSERSEDQVELRTFELMTCGHLFTAHLHEAVRRIFSQDALALTRVSLTGRESECLLWTAEGKTAWEISQILGIAERTVIYHIKNASEKLGVVNRQQAVARAVSSGLITPQFN